MVLVLAPDMELWLTSYLRATLANLGHTVDVGNKEPSTLKTPLACPLVVIRDDSGPRLSQVTFSRQIGVSVLAGSRQNDQPSNDLARLVVGILTDDSIITAPNSPIAAIDYDACNGPYAVVDDQDVARRYATITYRTVGSW